MFDVSTVRWSVAVLGSLLLTTGGCQCSDTGGKPWLLETGVDADVQIDATDGGDAVDAVDTVADTTEFDTSDATDVPTDTCRTQVSFDISYFGIKSEPARTPWTRAPLVTGEFVYTEREDTTEPMSGDLDIYQVHPDRVHWVDNGVADRLVAGASGRLLVHRADPDSETGLLTIIDRGAREEGPIAFSDRWEGPGYRYQQGSVRSFDGERFAFVLQNDPNATPGWVGYYDGEEVREIHIKEWTRKPVSLIADGFVLNTRTGPLSGGGNLEVTTWREGEGLRQLTETERNERDVVATSEAIFFNTDRRVFTADPESRETTAIHEGTCSPVGADGGRAVFSCEDGADGDDTYGRLILGRELYYFDGSDTERVPTEGGIVYSARIHGPHVVWAEYDKFGGGMPGEIGEIRYWRVGADKSVGVDRIGSPCRGCAYQYPEVNLSVGDGVIAWNYARPADKDDRTTPANGGLATIQTECR